MAAWPKQKPHSLAQIVSFTLNEGDGFLSGRIISADNDTMSTTARIDTLTSVLGNSDRTQKEEAFRKGNVADDNCDGVRA